MKPMWWMLVMIGCGTEPAAAPTAAAPAPTAAAPAPSEAPARGGKAGKRKAGGGGAKYDASKPPVCDALTGDLVIACTNGAPGVVKCSDYPGDLEVACQGGAFDPENGRWYAEPGSAGGGGDL